MMVLYYIFSKVFNDSDEFYPCHWITIWEIEKDFFKVFTIHICFLKVQYKIELPEKPLVLAND